MRATELTDLLKKGDRVAVSNITGREASKVSAQSQKYCANIIGGWALGKGGQKIETAAGDIPVFSTFEELLRLTPKENHPNKIIIYSPPEAVYGEVKEVVKHGFETVETILVITEHVSVEVTAKLGQVCREKNIDVLGCNTLGVINAHDQVRMGAVGGNAPQDIFIPGSVTIISNSGNMVNTIAGYLQAAGMGTSFGISTGKDSLILFPLKELLILAEKDERTKVIVLYVEPGGVYESEAIEMMKNKGFTKPVIVYVAGQISEKHNVSLGHAGAVVEGHHTSASGKMKAFDEYFGIEAYNPDRRYKKSEELKKDLSRWIRVNALHDIPKAVGLVVDALEIKRDLNSVKQLNLNPWFIDLGKLGKTIPAELSLAKGIIPEPYKSQFKQQMQMKIGRETTRQNMRNASHASSNDGVTPRIYGYSLMDLMKNRSFGAAVILSWTGELPQDGFEEKLVEMLLTATITNGPGTISAQGAKLSASAGNSPHTAMIGTLASIGQVHGGNGSDAARFLLNIFEKMEIKDPYQWDVDVAAIAQDTAERFKKNKKAAKLASMDYEKIPCLGHPVFKNDPINYDPRERVIYKFIQEAGRRNIFLEFYHCLVRALKNNGSMSKVLAVNIDAALACVWLGICWRHLVEKKMSRQRAIDIPFAAFALGRVAGGVAEYLDHKEFGTEMDMRIPTRECRALTSPRRLV
jgi:succinyl-CoA synthetase alpha subunit/citrate synthase